MRTTLILVLLFCLSIQASHSQNNSKFNSKLLVKFSEAEINAISENFPDSLLFLNYIADKGYYFTEVPPKPIPYTLIENFTSDKLANFNIFEYNVQFLENKNNYYKLGDTGKLLVLMSLKDIRQFSKQEKNNVK